MNAGLTSRSQIIAERGADFDEVSEQRAYERDRLGELGLANAPAAAAASPEEDKETDEGRDSGKL